MQDYNKKEIQNHLKDYLDCHLTPSKKKDFYICPFCHSGTGPNKSAAFHYYKNKKTGVPSVTCFSCHTVESADIFELATKLNHYPSFYDAYLGLAKEYHIHDDAKHYITTQSYLQKRGFTPSFSQRYGLEYQHNIQEKNKDGRILNLNDGIKIPYPGTSYYTYRLLNPPTWLGSKYYKPVIESGEPLFNKDAVEENKVIFITESQLCALSIIQADEPNTTAIALGGTGYQKLLSELEKHIDKHYNFIVSLDNDEAGKTTQEKLVEDLTGLGHFAISINISGEKKDPNEALAANHGEFYHAIQQAIQCFNQKKEPDTAKNYFATQFKIDRENYIKQSHLNLGFRHIDQQLGGLNPGLSVLGGIPSSGKTTFMTHIMDNLASTGETVIYISLEQTRLEIYSKCIARLIHRGYPQSDFPANEIIEGIDTPIISEAISSYQKIVGDHVRVVEMEPILTNICGYVDSYMAQHSESKPVIIIDYLQLIQNEAYGTRKDQIDRIIIELKQISRKYHLVVIVISSLSRAAYLSGVDFESFKESGSIEYTADYIFGLQPGVMMRDQLFSDEGNKIKKQMILHDEKEKFLRDVDFVCLKNRNGLAYFKQALKYDCRHDYFEEI